MKLHDNKANRVLIDISGQLSYDNKVEQIKQEITGIDEVEQDEIVDMALYMSNYYLNEREMNEDTSPLQDQRDFFKVQGEELIRSYYENNLPPITFKEDFNHRYLTVGDIRLSQYTDGTPILDKFDQEYCSIVSSPEEIYIDKEDLQIRGYKELMNYESEPDDYSTIMGITF